MDKGKDEYRKFSVDPNITSFEVLQSILCRWLLECFWLTLCYEVNHSWWLMTLFFQSFRAASVWYQHCIQNSGQRRKGDLELPAVWLGPWHSYPGLCRSRSIPAGGSHGARLTRGGVSWRGYWVSTFQDLVIYCIPSSSRSINSSSLKAGKVNDWVFCSWSNKIDNQSFKSLAF